MLISPTEPKPIKQLGTVSSLPEKHGADILIVGHKHRIGVQRKQFPGDLLASLNDGRLYEQIPNLLTLDRAVIIIEGHGRWTEDGELIADKWHRFTMQQINGLMYTIMFEFQIPVMWVKDMAATITAIEHLDAWAQKVKHTSLTRRSGPAKSSWGSTTVRHLAQHIMQGFPGVGPELAGRIVDKFEGAPLTFSATYEELLEVEGLGKGKADAMMAALGWAAK